MKVMYLDQVGTGLFFIKFAKILTKVPCKCTV